MRRTPAGKIALGGVLGAVAVVIMCIGTLIPLATYVCPMLCCIIVSLILHLCGRRIGWAWYVAVAILCLMLAPDKEAAVVFVFLGYYPLIKPVIDRMPLSWLWKLLLFNSAIVVLYAVLIYLMGMGQLLLEMQALGLAGLIITLVLGNLTFFLLDLLLGRRIFPKK